MGGEGGVFGPPRISDPRTAYHTMPTPWALPPHGRMVSSCWHTLSMQPVDCRFLFVVWCRTTNASNFLLASLISTNGKFVLHPFFAIYMLPLPPCTLFILHVASQEAKPTSNKKPAANPPTSPPASQVASQPVAIVALSKAELLPLCTGPPGCDQARLRGGLSPYLGGWVGQGRRENQAFVLTAPRGGTNLLGVWILSSGVPSRGLRTECGP